MPQSWRLLRVTPSREDWALIGVMDDDVFRGERDGESSIANWANAGERLLEPRHGVSRPREGFGEVGDLVLGGRDGKLALPGGRTHCHGGYPGIDVGYGSIC